MIIGIDASRANKPHKTGVEWYSYHLIEQFKKLDRRHQYFLYTNKPLTGALAICPPNFKEVRLKWPIPRSWTIGRLSWEMKFGKYRPDVLFVPAHTLPLLNPKKSVVTIHDIGFEHFPEAYHWADKLYHKLIIQIIKRAANKIIAPSDFTKNDLIKTYHLAPEKIAVIHNGYDNQKYRRLDSVIPAQACPACNIGAGICDTKSVNLSTDSGQPRSRVASGMTEARTYLKTKYQIDFPYILFIGRLELKKNIPRLVEAFGLFKARHPQSPHKLVLVGTKGLTFNLVAAQIKKFHLEKDIIMPGWVGDDDLPLFLNCADLFAFPSLFEGFGIPILEAMACGCPVICSNTTSLPEVADGAALMFDPTDTEAMATALEKMLTAEDCQNTKEKLIIAGLARANHFSWEKCARETLEALTRE